VSDIDTQLREAATQWRADQNPPAPFDASKLETVGRPGKRPALLVVAGAVLAGCAVVAVVALLTHVGNRSVQVNVPGTSGPVASEVPIATQPLLTSYPPTTGRIVMSTGHAGANTWTFSVQVHSRTDTPSGLCLSITSTELPAIGSPAMATYCSDPTFDIPALSWESFGPQPGVYGYELIYGVTSAPATQVLVTFGGAAVPVTTATRSAPALPGLHFFAVEVPPAAVRPTVRVEVEALAASGTPLLRSDPTRSPPVVSITPPKPEPTYPLWPLDPIDPTTITSAMAAARSFSATALGVTGNTITVVASDPYFAAFSIELPASGRTLQVETVPGPNGTWTLSQVGPPLQQGIKLVGPGAPTISIEAPSDATQSDVTERVDNTVHHIHETSTDLKSGFVHLVGGTINNVLIVFRNAAGAPVDAVGGEW